VLAKLKKIDIPIVVILLIFMVVSTMAVYSASYEHPSISVSVSKMLILYAIGFTAFITVSLFDYRVLLKITVYMYLTGIILLVAVYLLVDEINGAKGWFQLPGGLSFQPAELVKLILIMTLAAFLSRRGGNALELKNDLIPAIVIVVVPFTLVLIQPDLGNAIIFIVILLGMLWIANIRYTQVLIGTAVVVGLGFVFLQLYGHYHDPLYAYMESKDVEHWADRIDTFLNPHTVDDDKLFQVKNSIRAIGSGRLTGDGFLQGNSIHSFLIPLAYSDSIFVVIGEEFGFRGAAILLLIYFILIYRMILISIQSVHLSGAYIVVGVVSMYVFQVFENVGMLLGLMPLTGITLPFISYGGTSLLINMLCIGLVMSVKLHQDPDPFSNS
jgi:rod shape determining protein RodA